VESVEDLSLGSADLPPTDGLRYRLAEGARVIVRPSGTEPKLKIYLTATADSKAAGVQLLDAMESDMNAVVRGEQAAK